MSKYFYWNGLKIVANMIKNGVITENKLATAVQTKLNAKELPTVTDNGKILKVADGEWGIGEESSGNNDFLITYREESGVLTSDKTNAQILDAISTGKNLQCVVEGQFYVFNLTYKEIYTYNSTFKIMFDSLNYEDSEGNEELNYLVIRHTNSQIDLIIKGITLTAEGE